MSCDDFNNYSIDIDSECLYQDFDDIDLFGEKTTDDEISDNFGEDISFE